MASSRDNRASGKLHSQIMVTYGYRNMQMTGGSTSEEMLKTHSKMTRRITICERVTVT